MTSTKVRGTLQYRRLGRTNLRVSEISLGAVELGMEYGIGAGSLSRQPTETEAEFLLNRAIDVGINFIDTARAYGASEEIVGRALRHRRGEFYLNTKVASYEQEGLCGEPLRKRVTQSVRDSLSALRTDVIDVLMIHSASAGVIVRGELTQILEDVKKSGCIRFLGASVYGEEAALAAIRTGSFDCIQIAYSLLDRRPEGSVMTAARDRDVGIVARSVLLKGALTHRYQRLPDALEPLKSAVDRLTTVCGVAIWDLPELAYRFVLGQPLVHTALVGASNLQELEAAVRYAELGKLTAQLSRLLREVGLDDDNLLNPGKWPPC